MADHSNTKHTKILQFNQMKGTRSGLRDRKNENEEVFKLDYQEGSVLPGEYLIAVVEGNKIVEWRDARMYDMRCSLVN